MSGRAGSYLATCSHALVVGVEGERRRSTHGGPRIGGGVGKDERDEDAMVLKTTSTERQYCIWRTIEYKFYRTKSMCGLSLRAFHLG